MRTNGDDIPTYVSPDTTLRAKILDACGMTCTFCHNEGTPVLTDNRRRTRGGFISAGASGRVSIYAATNGARFLPAPMKPDQAFVDALARLRDSLELNELHLTGGEPTLHPRLPEIIGAARDVGYNVCMTSNGENGARQITACAGAGLTRVNFSIFGTTAAELAQVQHARFRDVGRAKAKITALRESIAACVDNGIKASANIVVVDKSHVERVHRLLDTYTPELSVRLLNSLDHGQASLDAIDQVLANRGATPEARYLTAGASGARTAYRLDDGRRVYVKWIRPVRLPTTCASCRFNNDTDCQEGFYGLRLYYSQEQEYLIGVCLQRMDLCLRAGDFLRHPLAHEVRRLREADYDRLIRVSSPDAIS
ncbi:hypothetical protein GCM10009799_33630 [Nocardiopsis rhodophaea]|uniref:Radical SAM core domain-containing protein n=1 Tax=Nocardiopsis rhodophaea TaxID=280238 RepID=A0ABN2TAZ1_9ACTN